jgi:hypothetical protein
MPEDKSRSEGQDLTVIGNESFLEFGSTLADGYVAIENDMSNQYQLSSPLRPS